MNGITRRPLLTMYGRSRDKMNFRGEVWLELRGPDGAVKQFVHVPSNAICSVGEAAIAAHIHSGTVAGSTLFGYLGIGTSTTAPATSDTALGGETGTRVAGTKSSSGRVLTMTCNFASDNPAGAATLNEVGIFHATTAGSILAHATCAAVSKAASDNTSMTYQVTV